MSSAPTAPRTTAASVRPSSLADVTVLIPVARDGNRDWLRQAVESFPRGTRYLVLENDGDVGGALNDGARATDTEFVYPFGADDIAGPGMLEFLVDLAWDADVVYPTMRLVDADLKHNLGEFTAGAFCRHRLQRKNFVTGSSLIRRSALLDVGGFRELETLEDWDLFVRMERNGARFKPAPETFFFYRQVPGSRNRSSQRSLAEWRQEIVGAVEPVLATFYYQATKATTYWRCQVPSRYLPGQCLQHAELGRHDDENAPLDFGDQEGAAVFQFAADKLRAFIAGVAMPREGIRVLVEVDDNYLDRSDNITRQRAGWSLNIGESAHTMQGHRWIVGKADGVICSTRRLAEVYAEVNPNVYVCRNSIDLSDWPEVPKPDDGIFRIGWFASRSHERDWRLVRSALSWASRQPGVQVVTMGYEPPYTFNRLQHPWSEDLGVYRRLMAQLDVGVCPVLSTGWADCRSDVKALEYAMSGALPVMSNVAPYEDWRDGPGLFAHSEKAWADQIKWCVRNRDEVRALAAEAKAYVMGERLIGHEIPRWREAVAA